MRFLAWERSRTSGSSLGSGSARHDIRFPNRRIAFRLALMSKDARRFPTAIEPAGIDPVATEPRADDAAVPDLHAGDKHGVVANDHVALGFGLILDRRFGSRFAPARRNMHG